MKLPWMIYLMMSAAVLMLCSCSSGASLVDHKGQNIRVLSSSQKQAEKIVVQPTRHKTKDKLGHTSGPRNFRTVIIDAGHGGKDSGAIVNGVSEKTLALDVAKRLKNKLHGNFEAVFVRSGDYFVDLDKRVRATDQFDDAVLVSIHLNYTRSISVRGPETYYFRVDSYSLAKRIQRAMEGVGGKERSRGLVRRRLRLTRNPQIPCVLVELGYLSNSYERRMLSKASYRDKMASALASALKDQQRSGDRGMGMLPSPLNRPLSRAGDRGSL